MMKQVGLKYTILFLVVLGTVFAGCYAVMPGTLMSSVSLSIYAVACLLGAFVKVNITQSNRLHLTFLILNLLYFGARAYFSEAVDLGVSDLMLLLPAASLYLLSVFVIKEKQYLQWIIGAFMLLLLLNLLCFVEPINELRDRLLPFAKGQSNTGMYNHRNFCSNFLMMGALVSAVFAVYGSKVFVRSSAVFFTIISICALALAGARSSFLGLIGGLLLLAFVYLISRKRGSLNKKMIASILVVGMIFTGITGYFLLENRGTTIGESTLMQSRMGYFSMAVDQIFDAPLVGSGSMSYSYKSYENWGDFFTNNLDPRWVHNEFIQIVTDYGVIGLLLTLTFLSYLIFKSIIRLNDNEASLNSKIYMLIGLTVTLSFCINSLLSFPGHSLPNLLFWVLGLACLSLSAENSKLTRENGVKTYKIQNLLVRIVLIVISVSGGLLSFNELKAVKVFVNHGIYVDNANWTPKEHTEDSWHLALSEVNKVSKSHLRLERLAGIKLELAMLESEEEIKQQLAEEALEYSEESLERHPYYAASLSNKAQSYKLLGRYEEASVIYDRLCKQVKSRRKFYRPFAKSSYTLLWWATELGETDPVEAINLLEKAEERRRRAVFDSPLEKALLASYIKLNIFKFMKFGQIEIAESELSEYYNNYEFRLLKRESETEHLHQHAKFIYEYAVRLHSKRKPSKALKWYLVSSSLYKIALRAEDYDSLQEATIEYEDLNQKIRFLKTANIKPEQ